MRELARPRRPWDRTPVQEREYFDILGPGVVAVLPPRKHGETGSAEWRPPTGGAWVHVGEDGRIRGFTGKAEMGQGTRTALSLVIAEELRVALDQVELVMADTDLCPWDMGTFGSRSMPDAAPALGRAAAGARRALIDLAASRLEALRRDLEAEEGEVRRRGDAHGPTYADLVRGQHRLELVGEDVPWTPAATWRRAGRSAVDSRAMDVVTGRREYVSDLRRPGMLHGVLLHPPAYGAELVGADLEEARQLPGITVVHEAGFLGAAAQRRADARAALARVRATWRPSPQPNEAEIASFLRSHPATGDSWDLDERVVGDTESALEKAPVTLEATYRTAYIAHIPLETHCAVAEWNGSRLTVWVGTQTPFPVRDEIAEALEVPVEDVRVIVPPTGAGFGGKHGGEIAVAAARLARRAGKPVRVAYTREEEFHHAYLRPMALIDVHLGAESDGRLVAWVFHNVNGGSAALFPPYRVPHQKIDNELSQSPLPQGSYRSLAAATNNFARESAMDEVAGKLDMDPLAIREINLADERLRTVLHRAAEKAGWAHRERAPGRGFGLAVGLEKGSRVATVAQVTVSGERRVHVDRLVTVFEAGAIVNPDNLKSQVEGASVMALGGALFEAIHFDAGVILNPRLSLYRVPRFSDLPILDVELVNRADLPPAGGGETPLIAVAPAIANAIFDAAGVRRRELPLVPDGRLPVA